MLLPTEGLYLHAATLATGKRDEMNPVERAVLYATAIQTGLRQNERRGSTKAHLSLPAGGCDPWSLRCCDDGGIKAKTVYPLMPASWPASEFWKPDKVLAHS